jgi:hypothetical protein
MSLNEALMLKIKLSLAEIGCSKNRESNGKNLTELLKIIA